MTKAKRREKKSTAIKSWMKWIINFCLWNVRSVRCTCTSCVQDANMFGVRERERDGGWWERQRGKTFLLQVQKSYGLLNLLHIHTHIYIYTYTEAYVAESLGKNITRSYIRERQIEARRGNSFWLTIPYWQLLIVIKPVSAITLIVPVLFSLFQTKTHTATHKEGEKEKVPLSLMNIHESGEACYDSKSTSKGWQELKEEREREREGMKHIVTRPQRQRIIGADRIEQKEKASEWKRIAVFIKVASWCRLD